MHSKVFIMASNVCTVQSYIPRLPPRPRWPRQPPPSSINRALQLHSQSGPCCCCSSCCLVSDCWFVAWVLAGLCLITSPEHMVQDQDQLLSFWYELNWSSKNVYQSRSLDRYRSVLKCCGFGFELDLVCGSGNSIKGLDSRYQAQNIYFYKGSRNKESGSRLRSTPKKKMVG